MNLLERVKLSLGIKSEKRDEELKDAIQAAKGELGIAGVETVMEFDDLTISAIKLYCRYWLNWQGDGERYRKHFNDLRDAMATAKEYRGDG